MQRQQEDYAVLEGSPENYQYHAAAPTPSLESGGVVLYDPLHFASPATDKTPATKLPLPHLTFHTDANDRQYQRQRSAQTNGRFRRNLASTHWDGASRTDSHGSSYGAIRPGGPVALLSRAHIGLLVNFLIIGIYEGMGRGLMYPFFKVFLHLGGSRLESASILLGFGWSCKFVFGYLSDCHPIHGRRRKPYAVVALLLLVVFTAGLAILHEIEPYTKPRGVIHNADAPTQSKRYVVLAMLTSFSHALLSVACEGLMVEYAHRESENERGRVQGMAYGVRYMGEFMATMVVTLGCSGEAYGGEFSFSVSVRSLLSVLAVVPLCGLYATHFHMTEDKMVLGSQPAYTHMRSLWRYAERRATWQITIAGFLQSISFLYKIPHQDTIYQQWLDGDTLANNLFYCISCAAAGAAIFWLRSDMLRNTSWRRVLFVATTVSAVVGLVVAYVTTEDVYRNKYFYESITQLPSFCDMIIWMVSLLMVVEIAEPGYEASSYAFVMTIYNLAIPISTTISDAVANALGTNDVAIRDDSHSVRHRVLVHYGIVFALRVVVGLGTIVFLPTQKRAAQTLKLLGNPNVAVPFVVVIAFVVLFFVTWISVILSMFQ